MPMTLIEILAQRRRAKAEQEILCTANEQEQDTEITATEEKREDYFQPSFLAFESVSDQFSEYF